MLHFLLWSYIHRRPDNMEYAATQNWQCASSFKTKMKETVNERRPHLFRRRRKMCVLFMKIETFERQKCARVIIRNIACTCVLEKASKVLNRIFSEIIFQTSDTFNLTTHHSCNFLFFFFYLFIKFILLFSPALYYITAYPILFQWYIFNINWMVQ